MPRFFVYSLLIVLWLTTTMDVQAGRIYVTTDPDPVIAGSTGNTLNVLVDLDSSDMSPITGDLGVSGYTFGFEFLAAAGIVLDPSGFKSFGTATSNPDLLLGITQGPFLGGPAILPSNLAVEGNNSLISPPLETKTPDTYGLATFTFDVAPSATSGTVSPTITFAEITLENGAVLALDTSKPGGITIEGASGPGPGGSVPEPASLAVWSVLGLVGVARARRRKSKLAVA